MLNKRINYSEKKSNNAAKIQILNVIRIRVLMFTGKKSASVKIKLNSVLS